MILSAAAEAQQTLQQFLEYWLENVYKVSVRLGTYRNSRILIYKHIIPGLGHIKLQKLTTQQVQTFYASKLKGGAKASRVRNMHHTLHSALDDARRARLVSTNVSDDVRLPPREEPRQQPLTAEQAALLLQKVKEHELEGLLMLALATGMREGELLGLRWSDPDFIKGIVQIERTLTYVTGCFIYTSASYTSQTVQHYKSDVAPTTPKDASGQEMGHLTLISLVPERLYSLQKLLTRQP